jgi:anti-sigma factor RsiW
MSAPDPGHPQELISALIDGELDEAQRVEVLSHLAGCAACRQLLEGLRAVARAAASEEAPPVPAGLERRIGWRLHPARGSVASRPARPWWRSTISLTAAATIAAFGILVGVWRIERGESRVPEAPFASRRPASPEKSEAAADRAAQPGAGVSPAPASATEPAVAAPPPQRRAVKERAALPAAPLEEAPLKRDAFAPAAPSRSDEAETNAVGGVAGGVVGGIMGGTLGEAQVTSSPRPEAPAAAKYAGADHRGRSGCSSMWAVTPANGWTLKTPDPAAAGTGLARLLARLDGRAAATGAKGRSWRLEVPRDRWPELAAALRDLGVAEADPALAVPETAACVEARVTVVP